MTNKTLQEILKEYPDDIIVSILDNYSDIVSPIESLNVETVYDADYEPVAEELIIHI